MFLLVLFRKEYLFINDITKIMLPPLEEIANKRRLLGLKQTELAKSAGVSQSLIAKLESGKIDSSYTKVKAIFDTLESLEVKTKIQAGKVLHEEVISIQKNEPVSRVVQLMKRHGYSQLPVFDGKRPVGSVSEKTIIRLILGGRDLTKISTLPVTEIMEETFPQVGEEAPVSLISSLLQVYSAVLVSKKGIIAGIITKADLLRML
ncbi:CBS domain-containing protein [Candidatus Bathyarchaeota archaeon]|nr:CBS domain-containing protein [Candidatus Bathyarchaeota archaeon]